jgi:hypothetical protein
MSNIGKKGPPLPFFERNMAIVLPFFFERGGGGYF